MAAKPRPVPWRAFLQELGVYTPLVTVYLLAVFAWVADVVYYVARSEPAWVYALLALCLMLGQALGLEILTGWLTRAFARRRR